MATKILIEQSQSPTPGGVQRYKISLIATDHPGTFLDSLEPLDLPFVVARVIQWIMVGKVKG